MKKIKVSLPPEVALDHHQLIQEIARRENVSPENSLIKVGRRSIDARSKRVQVHLEIEIYAPGETPSSFDYHSKLASVQGKEPVIVVGAGPAGLFAALQLIEQGQRPIILERGKDVRARRRDIAAINRRHVVNSDSNYCFGEGGAGTYSDGKLYTRSKKRGDVYRILQILVAHGAPEDILIDTHPHIGTNKLPKVVAAIRETILQAGGEIYFDTRVEHFLEGDGVLTGVKDQNGTTFQGKAVILATGHSARDIFKIIYDKGWELQVKPFAVGLRVEHQQALIDAIQYHRDHRGLLPAASYQLNHKLTANRSVFSFCMCPGGFIVPAATSPGELVVNGMSPSRRDSRFANSGIVISVDPKDFAAAGFDGPLAGMHYQQLLEQRACELAGGTQAAPAQRLMDFLSGKVSVHLADSSYQPGLSAVNLQEIFPEQVFQGIKAGFLAFGKRMPGYLTNEAQLVGVESRTSSPVRIPRDATSFQHPQIKGLFPCGEGAGYAGGIMSAALDGLRCAQAVLLMN